MLSHSIYKVPQGKLLKISLEYNQNKNTIRRVRITGDFFAYPEEAVEVLENELKNSVLEQEQLLKKIHSIIKKHEIQFIGTDAAGLTQAILMCKR